MQCINDPVSIGQVQHHSKQVSQQKFKVKVIPEFKQGMTILPQFFN